LTAKMEEPMEVFVFGVPLERYRFHRGVSIRYNVGAGWEKSKHMVEIWNEKTEMWQCHAVNEMVDRCPVCGTPMRCYYIPGTWWLACCSKGCYREFDAKRKELGDLFKALEWFAERREQGG